MRVSSAATTRATTAGAVGLGGAAAPLREGRVDGDGGGELVVLTASAAEPEPERQAATVTTPKADPANPRSS